jgi:hypothetical protein
MRDKLDNFLLATLWLLASTLGICFWFNIRFGFNIFSSAHWHHLAYMQASQNPVSPAFYISMVISVIVVICGLYLLIRPRFRKFKIPVREISKPAQNIQPQQTTQPIAQQPATIQTPTVAQTPAPTPEPAPVATDPTLTRPPRLNIALIPQLHSAPLPQQPIQTPSQSSELREIFHGAGYTVKNNPRIGTVQTELFAIGTNEVLWIGAVGIPTTNLQRAIDTVNQIFSDTLDDIVINVNGFVISAPDATAPGAPDILTFDKIDPLRQYINEHRNPPLGEDDNGNFDAFSAYISTVIDYLGKI